MIINQTIKNGFSVVSKTGRYFQLISAGGIVKVRLMLKGSVAFESDMWIGMNLDKNIEFDSVEIKGDDGPIQFWAGNVSMQLLQFGNDAAKAVRTSRLFVSGIKQVTSSDLTRKEIRIRASAPIAIGGAGMDGDGWTAMAGEVLTLPVAGAVYAEGEKAKIALGNGAEAEAQNSYALSTVVGTMPNTDYGQLMVSHNNTAQRVFVSGQTVLYSADGVAWVEHTDFQQSADIPSYYVRKAVQHPDGTMFIFERAISGSNVKVYRSSDGGLSFQTRKSISETEQKISSGIGSTAYSSAKQDPLIVGEYITWCWYSHYLIYNYIKNTWFCVAAENQAVGAVFVALSSKSWIRTRLVNTNTYSLQKTDDAGKTWRTVYNSEASFDEGGILNSLTVAFDGKNFYMKRKNANYPIISTDGGETWTKYAANIDSSYSKFISGDKAVWLLQQGGVIYYLDITDKSSIQHGVEVSLPNNTYPTDFCIDQFGQIYVQMNNYNYSWQMAVEGDLTPIVVEVMELLS